MYIIGIDPGVSGGMAIIPLFNFVQTEIYPFSKFSLADLSLILHDMRHGIDRFEKDTQAEVFIEQPSLNPYLPRVHGKEPQMRNSQSFWKLGRSLGQLEGICMAHSYHPQMVHPTKWQNFLGCRTGGNKKVTHAFATKVFPFLKKTLKGSGEPKSLVTHAVADALLIALYGYLQYANPARIPLSIRNNILLKGHTTQRSTTNVHSSDTQSAVPKRSRTSGTRPTVSSGSHRRMPPAKRSG